jgi:Flp pilus assembly protein TadG
MRRHAGNRRGNSLLEFTLCAVPLLFAVLSLAQMSMGMWYYHSIAAAVKVTARTATTRGKYAAAAGRVLSVGDTARLLARNAIGLAPEKLNARFQSNTTTLDCNPVSTCYANAGNWISLSGNDIGTDVTVTASYPFTAPIPMWVPQAGGVQFGTVTFQARSKQIVVF